MLLRMFYVGVLEIETNTVSKGGTEQKAACIRVGVVARCATSFRTGIDVRAGIPLAIWRLSKYPSDPTCGKDEGSRTNTCGAEAANYRSHVLLSFRVHVPRLDL